MPLDQFNLWVPLAIVYVASALIVASRVTVAIWAGVGKNGLPLDADDICLLVAMCLCPAVNTVLALRRLYLSLTGDSLTGR